MLKYAFYNFGHADNHSGMQVLKGINVNFDKSKELCDQAQTLMPGGVNSPVRSFKNVDHHPIYFDKAKGQYVTDVDGNKYIDYVNCWGASILGHSHPNIVQAVTAQSQKSLGLGACNQLEITLAKLITETVPSIDKVRMINSGTEATMTAIRLARGYTGRNKILKFSGCYHGHNDSLLVKAGSGVLTFNLPDSPGVPKEITQHTLIAPYNDLEHTKKLFSTYGDDIAAIIIEPIAANMNLILPKDNFLEKLSDLCKQHGALFICDEVITGYRVALGGAQSIYNIDPDITCLGKIIGGGLPVGAIGGKAEIMDHLAPVGPVYQAGTLSGNPMALAAGIQAVKYCQQNPKIYDDMNRLALMLMTGVQHESNKYGFSISFEQISGLFGFKFINDPNNKYFSRLFNLLLEKGIYIAPSPYEAGFITAAHQLEDIKGTIEAFSNAFSAMSKDDELNVYKISTNREPAEA